MEAIELSSWAPAPVPNVVAEYLTCTRSSNAPPTIREHEILVRMKLIPLHSLDMIHCAGILQGPCSAGCEGVGIIERVGKEVKEYAPGDRVVVVAWPILGRADDVLDLSQRIALWQELVVCRSDYILPIPDGMSDIDAAQSFVNPMSAYAMLFDALQMRPGQTLVLSGASSHLGLCINRIANVTGIRVMNLIRTASQIEGLRQLGYQNLLVYDAQQPERMLDAIRTTANGEADAGIDMVAGKVTGYLLNVMKAFSTLILVGTSSWVGPDASDLLTAGRLIMEGKRIQGFSVNKCWAASRDRETKLRMFNRVCDLFCRRILFVPHPLLFPFSQVREAVVTAGDNANCLGGKVFLHPSAETQ